MNTGKRPRGRPRKENPPASDFTALQNYYKSKPEVEELFSRTLRLLYEQLGRMEKAMFLEENLGYSQDFAKQAKELSTAVTSCGQMFFKIQESAKQAVDSMTVNEKVDAVCDMVRDFGRNNRYKFWASMRDLEVELAETDQLTKASSS